MKLEILYLVVMVMMEGWEVPVCVEGGLNRLTWFLLAPFAHQSDKRVDFMSWKENVEKPLKN